VNLLANFNKPSNSEKFAEQSCSFAHTWREELEGAQFVCELKIRAAEAETLDNELHQKQLHANRSQG